MNYDDADAFCKQVIGGRLILLKDTDYLEEFHNEIVDDGWIGINRKVCNYI